MTFLPGRCPTCHHEVAVLGGPCPDLFHSTFVPQHRVIIAGGRHLNNTAVVASAMGMYLKTNPLPTLVVSGGATGVDEMGENWARSMGIPVKLYRADWHTLGKAAGPLRNRCMADNAEALVAVWDGVSKGTASMIGIMQSLGKPTFVWRV